MSDVVSIKELVVDAVLGVTEEERRHPRRVVVDVDIETDTSAAGRSDDLGDTVDYAAVLDLVEGVAGAGEYKLLERLGHEIAARICALDHVSRVTVEVAKEPPVEQEVRAVAVRVEREP